MESTHQQTGHVVAPAIDQMPKSNIYTYKRDNLIKDGDVVIVYEGADNMKQIVMKKGT